MFSDIIIRILDIMNCISGYVYTGECTNSAMISTPDRRQPKTLVTINERGSKIARNSVFDCHLSPVGRQKTIENSVLTCLDLRLSIVLHVTFSIAAYPVIHSLCAGNLFVLLLSLLYFPKQIIF